MGVACSRLPVTGAPVGNGKGWREFSGEGRMTAQEGIGHVQRQDAEPFVDPTKPEWWTDRTWQPAT